MTTRFTPLLRALGVALMAALLLATPAVAQDDDHDDDDHHHGTATATAGAGSSDELGAFVRAGTCERPGDVVEDIGDLDTDTDDDDQAWALIGRGEPAPERLYDEDEDIHQTIEELTGADHVVTVHERDDASSPVVACGAITGTVDGDGTLLIDLEQVDDSGFEGRAHVAPNHDDDDDETEVTIGVWAVAPATPGGA